MTRFHWPWQREAAADNPLSPDPEALEALRVQRIKKAGAYGRRKQAEPIVQASDEVWEHNHLAEAIVAAAHRLVEGR